MKTLISVLLGFCLLGVSVVRADEKLPDSMPRAAAQDLDYAILKRNAKRQEIISELQKRLRIETAEEDKIIEDLAKKYNLHFDDNGKLLDTFDVKTGKISRATTTPPSTVPTAKSTKTAKAGVK